MWIAKIKLRHDSIFRDLCQEFNVSVQSVAFSNYLEKGKKIVSSMHYLSGDSKDIDKFVIKLKKDKRILKFERKKNMCFILENAKGPASFYNPKIIFIKPVLSDIKGYELWEIGSWDRIEISKFMDNVTKIVKDFELMKFQKVNLDNVFFPRLMPNLTDKQRQAIELAIKKGYYESPRKIDLRKLAKIMGVSLSTYQQHLRVSEEKLLPNILSYSL